ncbi:MAG: acetoin utilization protein AcuC [Coriobacteriia bacterium]|nr:acetoin utilization protein AcuC [Coriobacteriia bacterium]
MTVELVYTPHLADYRLSADHPLRPDRFVLAVELARMWGLIAEPGAEQPGRASLVDPGPIDDEDLLRVHTPAYIAAVRQAGADTAHWEGSYGIGPGDTPAFPHMHEAAAEVCAATIRALADVVEGRCQRAFSPAGGLHHAQRDRASGFCVYNDPAVAICHMLAEHPGTRVAYVDVDVHHGDGVEAAFWDNDDVLTVSVHESGRYLFPGTGRPTDIGGGMGVGYAVNLPLAPGAGDVEYGRAFASVIAPAVRAFVPDVMVIQLGADSHASDPLAHLTTTVAGQYRTAQNLIRLADEVCGGRVAATGGGGYDSFSAVPRVWACALAALLGVPAPAELPDAWRLLAAEAAARAGVTGEEAVIPRGTFEEPPAAGQAEWGGDPLGETERTIMRLRASHPLLRDAS